MNAEIYDKQMTCVENQDKPRFEFILQKVSLRGKNLNQIGRETMLMLTLQDFIETSDRELLLEAAAWRKLANNLTQA